MHNTLVPPLDAMVTCVLYAPVPAPALTWGVPVTMQTAASAAMGLPDMDLASLRQAYAAGTKPSDIIEQLYPLLAATKAGEQLAGHIKKTNGNVTGRVRRSQPGQRHMHFDGLTRPGAVLSGRGIPSQHVLHSCTLMRCRTRASPTAWPGGGCTTGQHSSILLLHQAPWWCASHAASSGRRRHAAAEGRSAHRQQVLA
jgi:hypothetical protein